MRLRGQLLLLLLLLWMMLLMLLLRRKLLLLLLEKQGLLLGDDELLLLPQCLQLVILGSRPRPLFHGNRSWDRNLKPTFPDHNQPS